MSNKENDRAFPGTHTGPQIGMSLRDYFAAKTMSAIYGNSDHFAAVGGRCDSTKSESLYAQIHQLIAKAAYLMADAMLERRAL